MHPLKIRVFTAAILVLPMLIQMPSAAAQQQRQFKSISEAVQAAREAKEPAEKTEIYSGLSSYSVESEEDVIGLYASMKDLEDNVKDKASGKKAVVPVGDLLTKCTDPKYHATIAKLLEDEGQSLPNDYLGAFAAENGAKEDLRGTVRTARILVLTKAAGDGKNNQALPALRVIYQKGGIAREFAANAIGKIGDPQDLDNFVSEIKASPKARVDLSQFGGVIIDRLTQEIDNPSVSSDERQRLIAHLGQAAIPSQENPEAAHATIAKYSQLLNHSNPQVVKAAARAIAMAADRRDSALIDGMFNSKDKDVRFQALMAVNGKLWSDSFVPQVSQILKGDADAGVRAAAANVLGDHRAKSAEPALNAALNDKSNRVRSAAGSALKMLDGEFDQSVQNYLKERKQKLGY